MMSMTKEMNGRMNQMFPRLNLFVCTLKLTCQKKDDIIIGEV